MGVEEVVWRGVQACMSGRRKSVTNHDQTSQERTKYRKKTVRESGTRERQGREREEGECGDNGVSISKYK